MTCEERMNFFYDLKKNLITFTGVSPDILYEAAVDLFNNTLCQAMWNTKAVVQDSVVCVDNREPYTPVCDVSYIHFVHVSSFKSLVTCTKME